VAPGTACVPETKLFHSGPTGESQRVLTEDGGQVLITTDCPTEFITSLPFRGCCLPSNECAISTHPIHGELGVVHSGGRFDPAIKCAPIPEGDVVSTSEFDLVQDFTFSTLEDGDRDDLHEDVVDLQADKGLLSVGTLLWGDVERDQRGGEERIRGVLTQ
jgi:hypothetical protein